MTDSPSFERKLLSEPDIEKIKGEISKFENLPETSSMPREEVIKKSIQNIVEPDTEEDDILPEYAKDIPEDSQAAAEHLIQVAVKEGLGKANKLAKNAHPSVMDMFHDSMSKHYLELEEKGLIK